MKRDETPPTHRLAHVGRDHLALPLRVEQVAVRRDLAGIDQVLVVDHDELHVALEVQRGLGVLGVGPPEVVVQPCRIVVHLRQHELIWQGSGAASWFQDIHGGGAAADQHVPEVLASRALSLDARPEVVEARRR